MTDSTEILVERYEDGFHVGRRWAEADIANSVPTGGYELEARQEARTRLNYSSRRDAAYWYGIARGYREVVRSERRRADSVETATEGGTR